MHNYQLLVVTITSKDTETRVITPYDDLDTATRKFHDAFSTIGAGPKKISVVLMDSDLRALRHEVWNAPVEQTTPTEQSE